MADKRELLFSFIGKETISPAARKAGDAVEDLGKDLKSTAGDAKRLDQEISHAQDGLRDLAREFARTDDAAKRLDLSKSIRKQQSEIRKLTRIKDLLPDDGIEEAMSLGARMGTAMGKMLPEGVSAALQGMPPQVQGVVVAAGAAIGVTLSAAVGAAITAGVLLAVGGGVLAAGIKSAADSPKVQEAWKGFGDRAKNVFDDFGKPFEGPLARAAGTFGDALERMEPTFKRMGESMAPVIDKLAPALADMAESALPGIEKALEAGKPLWDTLAEHLPDIGAAIDSFFSSIADGGPGANKFLGDFLNVLEGTIIVLGKVIGWLATLYGKAREVWVGIAGVFADGVRVILAVIGTIITGAAKAFGWIPGLGPKLQTAATEFDKFQKRANAALAKIHDKVVRITVEQHYKIFGKPGTSVGGIGGKGFKGLATGGPVTGPGPKGVDSEPRMLAPGEFVLNDRDVDAMGGFAGVEKFRNSLRGRKAATPYMPASSSWGPRPGGEQVVRVVIEGTGVLEGLRKEIRVKGGNVQTVLGK